MRPADANSPDGPDTANGFTLLEVLAVMLLTGIVLGVALNFYIDLSRASNRAAEHTREIRRATAILDRMARDFEATVLVRKPAEEDPLNHPWLFLGESEGSEIGADRIKFMTRNHRPRSTATHESDLPVVSYTLRRNERDHLELLRWSSPRLPEGLDRDFPSELEYGQALLSDDIDSFGVTFLAADGDWNDTWDSSQLVESSELPAAVKIQVAMVTADGSPPVIYERQVLLPVRPLDLEVLLDPNAEGESGADLEDETDPDDESPSPFNIGDLDDGALTGSGELTVGYCTTRDSGIRLGPKWDRLRRLRDANVGLAITDPRVLSFLNLDPELLDLLRPECLALLP